MKNKRRIHYPVSVSCMVIGMILAYIAFYFGNKMTMALYLEEQDSKKTQIYTYELPIQCQYQCEGDILANCLQDIQTGSIIMGTQLYVNRRDAECITHIIIKMPETVPWKLVSGSIPELDNINDTEPIALLGKNWESYTYAKNGEDYIEICSEEYRVTGYISAEHSVIYDNAIFLFWNNMGEKSKQNADYYASIWGETVVFQSNSVNVGKEFKTIQSMLLEKEIYVNRLTHYESWFSSEVPSINYRAYAYLTYVFCICIMVMVIEFWILQRKKEFAIRRMDGFSNIQLTGLIAKEIFKMLVLMGGVLFLIQIVFNLFEESGFTLTQVIIRFAFILLFIFVTFIFLMIYPLFKIMKGSVSETIQEGGRVR